MFDEDWVYFQAPPSEMTFINRIIEGCDYLGVVTALDGKKGIGFVRTTKDTARETKEVLQSLPIPVRILSRQEALAAAGQQ
ncbi:DUF4911 domain-containing protein [Megasphaera elsdenii]|uniref:DUF4911 domain-containing protein n=1 Tax=Megasphaera elsdenii TaxID=907 RepID=UPI00242CC09C|nr:DUF4911 domain-containing protein [Megasphaera elsdenii]